MGSGIIRDGVPIHRRSSPESSTMGSGLIRVGPPSIDDGLRADRLQRGALRHLHCAIERNWAGTAPEAQTAIAAWYMSCCSGGALLAFCLMALQHFWRFEIPTGWAASTPASTGGGG